MGFSLFSIFQGAAIMLGSSQNDNSIEAMKDAP